MNTPFNKVHRSSKYSKPYKYCKSMSPLKPEGSVFVLDLRR